MTRQLDPQIFSTSVNEVKIENEGNRSVSKAYSTAMGTMGRPNSGVGGNYSIQRQPESPRFEPGQPVPYLPHEIKNLEAQLTQAKAVIQQHEYKIEHLSGKLAELARESKQKSDKLTQSQLKLDESLLRSQQENRERLGQVQNLLTDRKAQDHRLQDLLDRQNSLIRNFENRLEAVQKLAADQEQALLSAFSALEDARAEIQRLRRL